MQELKIARIDVYQVDLPYSGGTYHLSGGRTYTSFDATLVCITTNTGIEGWGESTPFGSNFIAAHARGVRAGIAEVAPHLIGMDPRHVDRINDAMDAVLTGHEHVKTALDFACWDIFGKSVNMPVCDLLGGGTGAALPVISSVPAGSPSGMRARIADHRRRGFKRHGFKLAADSPAADAARVSACLADAQPGEFFLVDANGGLTVESALRTLRLLPPGLDFVLEAPCATYRECLSLRRRTDVPIHLDELATTDASLAQMVADDAVEGVGFKLAKSGGLTKSRRQRDICVAAGYTFCVQETMGSDVAFAAIVHFAQTVPESLLRCVLEARDMVTVKTADGDFAVTDGYVKAPREPGLGITVRREVLGEAVASYP